MELTPEINVDGDYASTFHISGLEPWILGFLKKRKHLGKVLEIGCGHGLWGFFLNMYVNNHSSLVGLDLSKSKLLKLKATKMYDDLLVADATKAPFRMDSFDTLVCIEVRQVFESDDTLINFERLIKRGGLLFLTIARVPQTFNPKILTTRGYEVYAYFLRGYFLISLTSGNVYLSIFGFLKRFLRSFLKLALKIKRKPYLIVTKIKA